MGSLAGAARPRKGIDGALRSTQPSQKLGEECKGISWLDTYPHNKDP